MIQEARKTPLLDNATKRSFFTDFPSTKFTDIFRTSENVFEYNVFDYIKDNSHILKKENNSLEKNIDVDIKCYAYWYMIVNMDLKEFTNFINDNDKNVLSYQTEIKVLDKSTKIIINSNKLEDIASFIGDYKENKNDIIKHEIQEHNFKYKNKENKKKEKKNKNIIKENEVNHSKRIVISLAFILPIIIISTIFIVRFILKDYFTA